MYQVNGVNCYRTPNCECKKIPETLEFGCGRSRRTSGKWRRKAGRLDRSVEGAN